jgi:hypothetical protein
MSQRRFKPLSFALYFSLAAFLLLFSAFLHARVTRDPAARRSRAPARASDIYATRITDFAQLVMHTHS